MFGRDKTLAENKKLLREQQNAVEPELKIRISRSVIPDFSSAFMKSIHKYKEKLATLMGTELKSSKSMAIKTPAKVVEKQRGVRG